MGAETMTRAERLAAALAFEKPDRVPVVPQVSNAAGANYCGVSQARVEDHEVGLQCLLKTFDDVGGWDGLYTDCPDTSLMQHVLWHGVPMRYKVPGVDLPEDAVMQVLEEEVMTLADYDRVIAEGFWKFYFDDYIYRIASFERGTIPEIMKSLTDFYTERCIPEWESRDVAVFAGGGGVHPFFLLSLTRSFTKFTEDLYYRPEIVEKALRSLTDEWIANALANIKQTGYKAVFIVEERASGFYYPLSVFERFWWPFTREFVDAMWSEGVVTWMHLDTDWGKNLPYFKRDLSRGSYLLQLDSTTDIFAAKELLRGHAMLYGDVPASLQSLGSVEDVENYCKKLIDEVGYEGGYILGAGCEVPPDCKPENLRAMVQTGKTYELSRKSRC